MSKREEREQEERLPADLERVLADLPGDPGAVPVMYRCKTHGLIPPEDVTWFPDMKPHCPYCNDPLEHVSGGEA